MDESSEDRLDATQIKEKESSRKTSGDSSMKQTISNTNKPQIKPQPPMKDSNNSSSLKNNDTPKLQKKTKTS